MNWIKKIRESRNLTQADLAKKIGMSILTISRYENDLREPRASDLSKLAEALNTTTTVLLNGPEKKRLEIIIDLEGVEEMDTEIIKSSSVFCGYRGSDDSLIFRGAVSVGDASHEDIIEAAVNTIRAELEAAYAGRARLKNA
jgi:transcriptional regulator with XRE-family HTH domain